MLGRTTYRRNTHHLLGEMQNYTATMEIRVVVFQEARNRPTSRFNYTNLWHICKELYLLLQRHLNNHAHNTLFIISRNWKRARFPWIDVRINNMWYTNEHYLALKNEIITFIGNWMVARKRITPCKPRSPKRNLVSIHFYVNIRS